MTPRLNTPPGTSLGSTNKSQQSQQSQHMQHATAPTGGFRGVNVADIRASMDLPPPSSPPGSPGKLLSRRVSMDDESSMSSSSSDSVSDEDVPLGPRGHRPTRSEIVAGLVELSAHAHSDADPGHQPAQPTSEPPQRRSSVQKRAKSLEAKSGTSHILHEDREYPTPAASPVAKSANNSPKGVSVRALRADTVENTVMKKHLHELAEKQTKEKMASEVVVSGGSYRGVEARNTRGSFTADAETQEEAVREAAGRQVGRREEPQVQSAPTTPPRSSSPGVPKPLLFAWVTRVETVDPSPPLSLSFEIYPRANKDKKVRHDGGGVSCASGAGGSTFRSGAPKQPPSLLRAGVCS